MFPVRLESLNHLGFFQSTSMWSEGKVILEHFPMECYTTDWWVCDLPISIVRAVLRQFCCSKCSWQQRCHWIAEQSGLHTCESSVWLKIYFRWHVRTWCQEVLSFFTCKEQWGDTRPKTEGARIWRPLWRLWIEGLEGCELKDGLLIHHRTFCNAEKCKLIAIASWWHDHSA